MVEGVEGGEDDSVVKEGAPRGGKVERQQTLAEDPEGSGKLVLSQQLGSELDHSFEALSRRRKLVLREMEEPEVRSSFLNGCHLEHDYGSVYDGPCPRRRWTEGQVG